MYYHARLSSSAATILYLRKQTAEAMYYSSMQSSRAATILYHRKQIAEAMWGGLAKPAADCQNRPAATTRKAPGANSCRLRLAANSFGASPMVYVVGCSQSATPPKEKRHATVYR
jgi:hypothetical protein